jgi:hypothetical protein
MQTGSPWGDGLAIVLSIGSPIWVCASVAHAVRFRCAIYKRFEKLRTEASSSQFLINAGNLVERYNAAETILQSFLQAPVRLSTRPGFLSSMIALPQNHGWWITGAAKLSAGQRRIEATFVAQNAIAVVAWLLSILADFGSIPGAPGAPALLPGNPNSAEWQICMGTLWLWLVSRSIIAGTAHQAFELYTIFIPKRRVTNNMNSF